MSWTQDGGLLIKHGVKKMKVDNWQEPLIEKRVTYILELDGKFIAIENVPARVEVSQN
jgi:hypothetical protein